MPMLLNGGREFAVEFARLSQRWDQLISERLKELNLTEARWCALYWLSRFPEGLSQTALAERAGVEAPTMVRTLDVLESQGLVRREPSKRDRRVNMVRLTEAGVPLVTKVKHERDLLRGHAMQGMAPQDYQTLIGLLRQMREGLDALAAAKTDIAAAA